MGQLIRKYGFSTSEFRRLLDSAQGSRYETADQDQWHPLWVLLTAAMAIDARAVASQPSAPYSPVPHNLDVCKIEKREECTLG
jgi:hypothetical protein